METALHLLLASIWLIRGGRWCHRIGRIATELRAKVRCDWPTITRVPAHSLLAGAWPDFGHGVLRVVRMWRGLAVMMEVDE